jgi:hypothetical protein
MGLLRRMVSLGVVVLALAGGGLAQTTAGSSMLGMDPRLMAWAAHDAVASGDGSKVPQLLLWASQWKALAGRDEVIKDEAETPGEASSGVSAGEPAAEETKSRFAGLSAEQVDERDAMAAVVDALIQMKVSVPADTLRGLAADFGSDVAVLLSRMPAEQARALAFEFYRQAGDGRNGLQYVSAAMLALHPVPGFAADLIANVKVRATVLVVLPGTGAGGGAGGGLGGAGFFENGRSDWPMIGQYALSDEKEEGDTQLVGGSNPVYARRVEMMHYRGPLSGVSLGPNERVQLIAEMLGISPEDVPWKTEVDTTIEYESAGQFAGALADFLKEQQDEYRDTVAGLQARELLTAAEAKEALPEMLLTLNDMRGEGAEPLPKWLELPSRVELAADAF